MEIKSTLKKPYTNIQKCDFIVAQNHKNGYAIKETDIALEAWGPTDAELAKKEIELRKKEILQQLDILDLKAVRPLRAIAAGTATEYDHQILEEIECQVEALRAELRTLEG